MKKYRLIKEYPGSPKLGTIVENKNGSLYFPETNSVESSSKGNLFKEIVINNPEFWEEVIEKEYEIITFKNGSNGLLYTYHNSGKWVVDKPAEIGDRNYEYCLKHYHIHSVKRLSDGEVFTVGDNFNILGRKGKIKSFEIISNLVWVKSENNPDSILNGVDFKKVKQPLFTSEDGVDVYEGDKVYYLDKYEFLLKGESTAGIAAKYLNGGWLFYSTREAAEEYIIMNKPCLSINDFIKANYGIDESELLGVLKELVKEKLI